MTARHIAAGLLLAGASLLPIGAGGVAFAQAATASRTYSIPPQPLGRALSQFAEQSGVDLVFSPELVRGKSSVGLNGTHTPDAAIDRMLRGSGLVWSRGEFGNFIIRAGQGGQVARPTAAQRVEMQAAADPAAESAGLDEIVVTAQKRSESLQDTPISLSVISSDTLRNQHIVSIDAIGSSVPGVTITPTANRSSATLVSMRGLGVEPDANQPARDPSVGIYVDGVYIGRPQGLGTAFFDIERIEVLKGPQGTLFGRNTQAGAINIVSRRPSGQLGMATTFGVSNFGGREVTANVNLPRMGNVSVKFDGVINQRGGTVDNGPYSDYNMFDKRGLRIAALWEPSDGFSALYSFDISRDVSTPGYIQLTELGTVVPPIYEAQPDRATSAILTAPQRDSVGKVHGHHLTLEWAVASGVTMKSISAYRSLNQSQFDIGTNTGFFQPNRLFIRDSQAHIRQSQYSQEIQLLGDLSEIDFIGGMYYFHEKINDTAWSPNIARFNADGTDYILLPEPIAGNPFPDRGADVKVDSAAIFGQATWSPDALEGRAHLTVGGRYTRDKKWGSLYAINGVLPTVGGVARPQILDATWNRFDPMINLSVDVSRDVMIYGKWSTGYKSGGANTRSLTFRGFAPESIETFEIGAKTEFLDRRARFNIAAFSSRYKDKQIDFQRFNAGENRVTLETINAFGTGKIKGIEADLTLAPVQGLTLSAAYAYIDSSLPPAANPYVEGSPLNPVFATFTPKHSASGAIDYKLPVDDMMLLFHLDGNYASRQYGLGNNTTSLLDERFLLNARIALDDIVLDAGGMNFELAVWARNLLNNSFTTFAQAALPIGYVASFNEPRTYGVQLTMRF